MLPASPRRSWPTSLLLGAPSLIPRGILRPFVAPAHDVSPLAHSLPLYLSTSSRHTQQTQKPKPLAPHEQSAREHNTHHHVPNSNDTVGWVGGAAGTAEKLPAQKPKPYQREKATSIPWWNFRCSRLQLQLLKPFLKSAVGASLREAWTFVEGRPRARGSGAQTTRTR